ncbi:hypothetical protein LUZ60_004175 [Juncus effusus]|nr:hypothetical protein LUZ60_004175 [Juncus effusus]
MSNQQVVAPRISTNGFGPRRAERDNNKPHSAKPTGIMNGGRLTNASPSRDRIMYVMVYLIGQRVDVHVKNGSVISGIFHTANDKDFGIVLKMAQVTKDGSVRGQKSLSDIVKKPETMVIPSRELVQIIAKDVGLTSDELANNAQASDKKKDLMIDSVISNSRHVEERELEKWAPDGDDQDCLESLEQPAYSRKWTRKWDQFETNEALFGVKSTFNEDIYTTKLVKGPHMRELELQASRIAREIEGEDTDDLHLAEERGMEFLNELEIDEELRYSAVTRDTDSWQSSNTFTDSWRRPAEADSWRKPAESQTDSWRRPGNDSWRSLETQQNQSSANNNNNGQGHVDLSTSTSLDVDAIAQTGTGTGAESNECAENKSKSVDEGFRLEGDQMKDEEEEFVLQPQPDTKPSEEDNKLPASEDTTAEGKKGHQEIKEAEKASSETVNNKAAPTTDQPPVKVNSQSQSQSKPSSSASNTSTPAGLSRTSSMASDKSSLNPNAKEFKLNPHARSFMPNFRPATPPPPPPPAAAVQVVPEQSFYYPPNLSPVPPPQMPIPMMGGAFGQQQFMYNPQTGVPMQQAFVQPNPPPYGQQMMMGQPQPRAMYYMPTFAPPPEMQYRGRNY